jgi:hypothetical protein
MDGANPLLQLEDQLTADQQPGRALWSYYFGLDARGRCLPGVWQFGASLQCDGFRALVTMERYQLELRRVDDAHHPAPAPTSGAPSVADNDNDARIEKQFGVRYVHRLPPEALRGYDGVFAIDPNREDIIHGLYRDNDPTVYNVDGESLAVRLDAGMRVLHNAVVRGGGNGQWMRDTQGSRRAFTE